jgi:2-succinyl-5-enolpyruvyl-6-hydroxy-3-cyclohexene-1-carboxylate synthase
MLELREKERATKKLRQAQMVMNIGQGTSSYNLKKMLEKNVKYQISNFKDGQKLMKIQKNIK